MVVPIIFGISDIPLQVISKLMPAIEEIEKPNCDEVGLNVSKREKKLRLVLLGTGFAGLSFIENFNNYIPTREKDSLELTVIDSRDYLLFSPFLYEVATGQINESHVLVPVANKIGSYGYKFIRADVKRIDPFENKVITSGGQFPYDILVIALGSESNDYGIEGVSENAIPLKNIEEGIRVRKRILESYKKAINIENIVDAVDALTTVVVIGGGAAGVELSASVIDLFEGLNRNRKNRFVRSKVVLVEMQEHLMIDQGKKFSNRLERMLAEKGVELQLGKRVVKVDSDGVILSDGSKIASQNIFWTAGVKPSRVISSLEDKFVCVKKGRVVVDPYLSIPSFHNIYVVGDSALPPKSLEQDFVPQTAAAAVQEGKFVGIHLAHILCGKSKKDVFCYRNHGAFLSVGHHSGICKFSTGLMLTGYSAWAVWGIVHLLKIETLKNKIDILFDWTFARFHLETGSGIA